MPQACAKGNTAIGRDQVFEMASLDPPDQSKNLHSLMTAEGYVRPENARIPVPKIFLFPSQEKKLIARARLLQAGRHIHRIVKLATTGQI
jgi:hypothetical protein